jgi:hypothetical protein
MLTNATLDLRHVMGGKTDVGAYAHSTVTKGDIRGEYKQSDYDRAPKMLGIHIGLGLNIALPMAFSSNQQGSPYNTNHAFEFHILGQISDFPICNHWSWNINIDASATWMQLDNVVAAQDDQLVLDPSYGATPPRQSLYWCSVGLPVTLKFGFGKWGNPYLGAPFRGLYATLTPTLNFKPRLVTKSLDEDSHWSTDRERVDILSRFNIRAAIGLNCNIGGLDKVEFYIDLLPSFRSSAEAPQTRMFGLGFVF